MVKAGPSQAEKYGHLVIVNAVLKAVAAFKIRTYETSQEIVHYPSHYPLHAAETGWDLRAAWQHQRANRILVVHEWGSGTQFTFQPFGPPWGLC